MASQGSLAVIEQEGRRIIEYAQRHPERVVPQYPTWTQRDLAIHVASIHGRTAAICETLPQERIPTAQLPEGRDPFDWAGQMLAEMVEALASADPGARVWTFGSDPTLRFWERRMVIETGVHRWDAQGALGQPDPLLPEVASDGLDEFPDMYLGRLGDVPTIDLVATDLGRSWRYGEGEPVAAIEDTASALFLRLMSRPGADLPATWQEAVDALGSPADAS